MSRINSRTKGWTVACWVQAIWRRQCLFVDTPKRLRNNWLLCCVAINQSGLNLRWIPNAQKTQPLCEAAVSNNGFAIEWVPECYLDPAMRKLATRDFMNNAGSFDVNSYLTSSSVRQRAKGLCIVGY